MPEHAADSVTGTCGVLDGIRVLDCTFGLAGPEATRLLAEAGADVVKVEPSGGDPTRGAAAFATWNRSKRGVVLDLDDDGDRQRFDRLLAGADVLVHGFRPSRARELGLDDATLAQRHPHLIASAVTGYPGNHPDAELPGWDILVQARSGAMWEVDGARPGPIFLRLPVPSWATCYLVTVGILARLLVRHRTGQIGPAHTSLLQGMLSVLTMLWHRGEHISPDMKAKLPLPKGFPAPAMSMFQCAEGAWLQLLPGYLEHPLLIETVAELGEYIDVETAYPIPSPEQLTTIRTAFRRRSLPEWLAAFQDGGYPAEPVRALGTVFADPQAIENGYVVELDDPKFGRVRQSGSPYEMTSAATVYGAAPELGSVDADDVAWDPRTSNGTDGTGLDYPLAGLRVLDVGMFLAAPMASMLFADMGAEVIKVEPPTGDRMRVPAQMTLFVGCQRGKRAIVLDLTDPASRPAFERLVRWADVVHHNLRGPAARSLGVDYESLRKVNPRLVFCHVSAYGEHGRKAEWPGYDPVAQAMSGWPAASTAPGTKPMWYRFGMMDHTAALQSMIPTLLALLRREQTGEGSAVSSSLLGAAVATNSETFLALDRNQCEPVPTIDDDQTGLSPYYRIYRTGDERWIAVAAVGPAAQSRLLAALQCDAAGLEAAMLSGTATETLALLQRSGVQCELVREDFEQQFFDTAFNRDAGLIASYRHAEYGAFEQPGAFWDFGDLALRLDRPPPALGEHTEEVLAELGLTAEEIERCTADKIATAGSGKHG